ncbi:hypothetical protein DU283_22825 [Escherichia coli]|nr:hypothetical protein DU283_22825 [Escherichia coli]
MAGYSASLTNFTSSIRFSLYAYVLSWFPTTGTYSAFNNLRRANKNHKADNTWRDAVVITERSDDIFPD